MLACSEEPSNTIVAQQHRTISVSVGKWRRRFIESRLDGLYDDPREGGPRSLSDEEVEAIIVQTLETTPKGQTHWSTRKMAKKMGISTRWSAGFGVRSGSASRFAFVHDFGLGSGRHEYPFGGPPLNAEARFVRRFVFHNVGDLLSGRKTAHDVVLFSIPTGGLYGPVSTQSPAPRPVRIA